MFSNEVIVYKVMMYANPLLIAKQSQLYTQANTHGEVAKIQPPWCFHNRNVFTRLPFSKEFFTFKHFLKSVLDVISSEHLWGHVRFTPVHFKPLFRKSLF